MKIQEALDLVTEMANEFKNSGCVPCSLAEGTGTEPDDMKTMAEAVNMASDLVDTFRKGATIMSGDQERLDALKLLIALALDMKDQLPGPTPGCDKAIQIACQMVDEIQEIIGDPAKKIAYAKDVIAEGVIDLYGKEDGL
jgi:hypothetical protein